MRERIKRVAMCALATAVMVASLTMAYNASAYNKEDGDVIDNPWKEYFTTNKGGDGDLVIDDQETTTARPSKGEDVVNSKIYAKKLATKIKSASKKKSAKKAKIVLKKVTKVKGVKYQIKYATSKKFKKAKIKSFKKNKITLKKLKAGKKYYIKARARVKVNGKFVNGKWTKRKAIKMKK